MFDTFAELEKRAKDLPVRLGDDIDQIGYGTLSLNCRQSRLVLCSKTAVTEQGDASGWFDIQLNTGDGSKIWLHHCVGLGMSRSHHPNAESVHTIFPNILVFDAENLTADNQVRTVSFQLEGLSDAFLYKFIDSHGPKIPGRNGRRKVKALERLVPKDFKIDEILVVHSLPQPVVFFVKGRRYSIFFGGHRSVGWSTAAIGAIPILTIDFERSYPLDFVMDEVWAWKRFFSQLMMRPLSVCALWIRSSGRSKRRVASIYLPNEQALNKSWRVSSTFLRTWEERRILTSVMRNWLKREPDRRVFRVSIDQIIESSVEENHKTDIVAVCSAIEGLQELRSRSSITKGNIKKLVDAAYHAAISESISLTEAQIQGALGTLRAESLSTKLARMLAVLEKTATDEMFNVLIDGSRKLRNSVAHGRGLHETSAPLARSLVDGLLSAAVQFDLFTCGAPTRSKAGQISNSMVRLLEALRHIEALKLKIRAQ